MKLEMPKKPVCLTRKHYQDFFDWLINSNHVPLVSEEDPTLSDPNHSYREKELIYYPENIYSLFSTQPFKRMDRILQTGTNIYSKDLSSLMHTRLQHSKGTYALKLDVLIRLFDNPSWRKLFSPPDKKKYLMAELLSSLLHDIGHGPFSHTFETIINAPKGNHEIIARRIILENEELRTSLETILPELPMLIVEVMEKDPLGLHFLDEGNIDIDRGDFIVRDVLQLSGISLKQMVDQIFTKITYRYISDDGVHKKPVFQLEALEDIKLFLNQRFENYKNVYYSKNSKRTEHIFETFGKTLASSDSTTDLKYFLSNNIDKTPYEIDIDEFVKWDDVRYMKNIIKTVNHPPTEELKSLAYLSIPNEESFYHMQLGLLSKKEIPTHTVSDRIHSLMKTRDQFCNQNCKVLNFKTSMQLEHTIKNIQNLLHLPDMVQDFGIIPYSDKIMVYDNKTPIYIEDENKKVYNFAKHPQVSQEDLREETLYGLLISIPSLKEKGISPNHLHKLDHFLLLRRTCRIK